MSKFIKADAIQVPLTYILIGAMFFSTYIQLASVTAGREWSYRYSIPDSDILKYNIKYVLHDHKYQGSIDAKDIGVLIVTNDNPYSGQAKWINPKAKIINIDYLGYLSDESKSAAEAHINNELIQGGKIYGIVNVTYDMNAYAEKVSQYGFEILSEDINETNIGEYYCVEMKYNGI